MVVLCLWLAVVYSLAYLKNAPLFEQNLNIIKENNQALANLREQQNENKFSWTTVNLNPIIIESSRNNPEKNLQKISSGVNIQLAGESKKINFTSYK